MRDCAGREVECARRSAWVVLWCVRTDLLWCIALARLPLGIVSFEHRAHSHYPITKCFSHWKRTAGASLGTCPSRLTEAPGRVRPSRLTEAPGRVEQSPPVEAQGGDGQAPGPGQGGDVLVSTVQAASGSPCQWWHLAAWAARARRLAGSAIGSHWQPEPQWGWCPLAAAGSLSASRPKVKAEPGVPPVPLGPLAQAASGQPEVRVGGPALWAR